MCLAREWTLFDDNDDDDQADGGILARLFCVYPIPAAPLKGAGSLKGAASKGRGVAMTMTMTMTMVNLRRGNGER